MNITTKNITLKTPLKAITYSNCHENIIYGISTSMQLVKIDITSEQIIDTFQLEKGEMTWEKIDIQIAPNDTFVSVVDWSGRYGLIYDLKQQKVIIQLDRKDYHTEQTKFPLLFFEQDQETILIHATDWNRLDITNVTQQKLLTERTGLAYKEPHLEFC